MDHTFSTFPTMDSTIKYLILLTKLFLVLESVDSYTYSVKVATGSHVNVVDTKFLSFTVDPKYLFSSNERFHSKESTCMATSLTPAYIRIAGASTSHLTFRNSSITFTDLGDPDLSKEDSEVNETLKKKSALESNEENDHILPKKGKEHFGLKKRLPLPTYESESEEHSFKRTKKTKRQSRGFKKDKRKREKVQENQELSVTHSQWQQFVHWTKKNGFDLVFALNNNEKTTSGLWDPNTALNILTLADQANVSGITWQLGYECSNQSIDDYLNDLETLRAVVDTYSDAQEWKTIGGDVTKCLQADSKSDFSDYVTLTDDMMDAVVLNGNSSAHELDRMSERDRLKLLHRLSTSSTPLWLTDSPQVIPHSELHRAADWVTSLGYSARNGFSVHFRELIEEELFEPTLSFYMALLFKNLVGEKVLNVDMEGSQAVLFAHCTSLRHKPVPGAVTIYGTNLDDETARFAIKMSRREDGGDIMQFILGHDLNGNIIINGKSLHEGHIKPTVKRVRAYKTLLLNLPPKSFGFWVIASTKIEACHETEEQDIAKKDIVEAFPVDDDELASANTQKTKRSMIKDDVSKETLVREGLKERIDTLSENFKNINKFFDDNEDHDDVLSRKKRQLDEEDEIDSTKKKIKSYFKKKYFDEPKPRLDFIRKLVGLTPRSMRTVRHDKARKNTKGLKSKGSKRNAKYTKAESHENIPLNDETANSKIKLNRKRRSVVDDKEDVSLKNSEDVTSENEIFDAESSKEMKLWRILRKIHKQIKDLSIESDDDSKNDTEKHEHSKSKHNSEDIDSKDEEEFVVKTKMEDDGATLRFEEKTKHGVLKTTINNVVSVIGDLNKNLNKFWNALTLLE